MINRGRQSKRWHKALAMASLAADGLVLWAVWGHPVFFLVLLLCAPFIIGALLLLTDRRGRI